jgi:hypothetical protein
VTRLSFWSGIASSATTPTRNCEPYIILNEAGFRLQNDDNDHGGPAKAVPLGAAK